MSINHPSHLLAVGALVRLWFLFMSRVVRAAMLAGHLLRDRLPRLIRLRRRFGAHQRQKLQGVLLGGTMGLGTLDLEGN